MDYTCRIPKPECSVRSNDGSCNLKTVCEPVVEQCVGCGRVLNNYCVTYLYPRIKWNNGKECPIATHKRRIIVESTSKKRVGQQKQNRKRR